MRKAPLLLLLASPLLAGCPNTDTAVFVDPTIASPAVTVTSSLLATGVKGSFNLSLHLGARASGPSEVSVGQFSIKDEKATDAIVSALVLSSGSVSFPVHVEPDSDVDVTLTFDMGEKVPAETADALCAGAGLTIGGTIQDSLQNTGTPVGSAVFQPVGCK